MLHKISSIILLLLGTLALASCGSSSNDTAVTGTVTYLQRIALPPEAVMTVRIEDVSRADAPTEVIGEQVVQTKDRQVPFSFKVTYDAGKIEENHTYSLR